MSTVQEPHVASDCQTREGRMEYLELWLSYQKKKKKVKVTYPLHILLCKVMTLRGIIH